MINRQRKVPSEDNASHQSLTQTSDGNAALSNCLIFTVYIWWSNTHYVIVIVESSVATVTSFWLVHHVISSVKISLVFVYRSVIIPRLCFVTLSSSWTVFGQAVVLTLVACSFRVKVPTPLLRLLLLSLASLTPRLFQVVYRLSSTSKFVVVVRKEIVTSGRRLGRMRWR